MKGLRLRDARTADKEAVLGFCRKTWPEYGDYIHRVWNSWIRQRSGRLIVAELERRPVGLAKITDYGAGEIWLEGLRVDRRFRRQGIANAINEEVLRTLKRMAPGRARFCTAFCNRGSRRIGEKHGFKIATRFRNFWQKPCKGKLTGRFATPRDLGTVWDFVRASEFIKISSGLIASGWVFRQATRRLIAGYIRERRVMLLEGGRDIRGLAIYPYEGNDRTTSLGFVDGSDGAIKTLTRNCKYLAESRGEAHCSVSVPTRRYARLVEAAGFDWKESIGQVVMECDLAGGGHRKPG